MDRHSSLLMSACLGVLAIGAAVHATEPSVDPKLRGAVNSSARSPENKARDQDQHPLQTLTFLGIRPSMTVVEMWPFGGLYTEILAPYLHDHGTLYAAATDPASTDSGELQFNSALKELFATNPQLFDKVQLSVLSPGRMQIAPDGTADMVLSFRTNYNWLWAGSEKDVFAAAFRALKPGGILGVVEFRSDDPNAAPAKRQGYVGEQYAINLIESVGFQFAGRSDINRNPRDTKDYPKGAWSLPPYYAEGRDPFTDLADLAMLPIPSSVPMVGPNGMPTGLSSNSESTPVGGMKFYMHIRSGDPDTDRPKYPAIGEADRFTLKFVKPWMSEIVAASDTPPEATSQSAQANTGPTPAADQSADSASNPEVSAEGESQSAYRVPIAVLVELQQDEAAIEMQKNLARQLENQLKEAKSALSDQKPRADPLKQQLDLLAKQIDHDRPLVDYSYGPSLFRFNSEVEKYNDLLRQAREQWKNTKALNEPLNDLVGKVTAQVYLVNQMVEDYNAKLNRIGH